jgi:hypothetical protein
MIAYQARLVTPAAHGPCAGAANGQAILAFYRSPLPPVMAPPRPPGRYMSASAVPEGPVNGAPYFVECLDVAGQVAAEVRPGARS